MAEASIHVVPVQQKQEYKNAKTRIVGTGAGFSDLEPLRNVASVCAYSSKGIIAQTGGGAR